MQKIDIIFTVPSGIYKKRKSKMWKLKSAEILNDFQKTKWHLGKKEIKNIKNIKVQKLTSLSQYQMAFIKNFSIKKKYYYS